MTALYVEILVAADPDFYILPRLFHGGNYFSNLQNHTHGDMVPLLSRMLSFGRFTYSWHIRRVCKHNKLMHPYSHGKFFALESHVFYNRRGTDVNIVSCLAYATSETTATMLQCEPTLQCACRISEGGVQWIGRDSQLLRIYRLARFPP